MTLLQIMSDQDAGEIVWRSRDEHEIAEVLAPVGVEFSRWDLPADLPADAGKDEVLAAFHAEVEALCVERGFGLVDVASLLHDPDDPDSVLTAKQARERFLEEHRHDEDEVRFFAVGRGCFYLHLDGRVFALVCEAGDLVAVPAGTPHWYDMGTAPHFTAIRFFEKEDGWVGDFSGSPISSSFPTLDDLIA